MDTLDDFTVMNIIAQCDLRTAFSVVPLICRRMYALYDDVTVVRRFRDALCAHITTLRDRYAIASQPTRLKMLNGYAPEHCTIPFELVAKANLGEFSLDVAIHADMHPCRGNIAELKNRAKKLNDYFFGVKYVVPCKLTTPFGEVHAYVNRILNTVHIRVRNVTYMLRNSTTGLCCDRDTDRDKPMYDLGLGHKYTTLDVTIYHDMAAQVND